MANTIGLQSRQVFLSAGEPAAYAQAYFYESGTATMVNVYSDVDLLNVRSQPVTFDADGVMPVCYIGDPSPLRILITDEDDVALPGYPMDNIVPEMAEAAAASTIGFTPTDELPYDNVQDAIEGAAALSSDQTALAARSLTPFDTGGTGNAYTLTPSPAITSYASGQAFLVRPDRTNTAAPTMNINGLGARALEKIGRTGTPIALVAGEIQLGREFLMTDDGTRLLVALGRDFPLITTATDGMAIRWGNGLQICTKILTGLGPISITDSDVFRSGDIAAGSWARTFIASPAVTVCVTSAASGEAWGTCRAGLSVIDAGTWRLKSAQSSALTSYVLHITATGKWF
jgi:hypothetical protein